MKLKKFLFFILCLFISSFSKANVLYTSELKDENKINKSKTLAENRPLYIAGFYNLNFWQDKSNKIHQIKGKESKSFDIVIGHRVYDTFRIEANYTQINTKYDKFSFSNNGINLNFLFDGRVDSIYRIFKRQLLMPYIGFGVGTSWGDIKGNFIASGLFGISLELEDFIHLDFGYKYTYMSPINLKNMENFSPISNGIKAGIRINF